MPNVRPILRVAYIYQSRGIIGLGSRGAPTHIYHVVRSLQRAGHRASLLALQGRQVLYTDDIEAVGSDSSAGLSWATLGWSGAPGFELVESVLRRTQAKLRLPYLGLFDSLRVYDVCVRNLRGYDVLHERFNMLAIGGTLASRKLGIPLVLEVNADGLAESEFRRVPVKGARRTVAEWATRFALQTAAKVICVSAQLRDHMVGQWQVDPAKIAVLPNAADTEVFARHYDTSVVRQRLGLADELVVLFVGGFWEWHDLRLLLEAFGRVLTGSPQVRLVLVGDGPTRSLIEEKVEAMELQHSVVFAGAVNHSKVPEILSCADVVVAPNVRFPPGYGGSPLKLFEYMAAGKAIVATHTGQVAEVIEEGVTGLLVEPGDVAGFAGAMARLLDDPRERAYLGTNARRQAEQRHSWDHYCHELARLYSEALDAPSYSIKKGE